MEKDDVVKNKNECIKKLKSTFETMLPQSHWL